MKAKKELFINQAYNSVKSFDYYKSVSNNNISKTFKYFFILILVYAAIITISLTYETNKVMNNTRDFIESELHDITYSEGILRINNDEKKNYMGDKVIIDTSAEDLNVYDGMITIGRKEFRINVDGKYATFSYQDFIKHDINEQDVLKLFDFKKYSFLVVITIAIISYVTMSVSTLLDILVIALIGLIISTFVGNNKIKFKNLFNIATHAITLPVILSMIYFLVNIFTGFEIKYFSVMYSSIAIIYECTAIILINTEKNNT